MNSLVLLVLHLSDTNGIFQSPFFIFLIYNLFLIFIKGIYPCNNKFTFTTEMNATLRGSVRIHRIRITEGPLESVSVPDVRINHLVCTSTYQPAQTYR